MSKHNCPLGRDCEICLRELYEGEKHFAQKKESQVKALEANLADANRRLASLQTIPCDKCEERLEKLEEAEAKVRELGAMVTSRTLEAHKVGQECNDFWKYRAEKSEAELNQEKMRSEALEAAYYRDTVGGIERAEKAEAALQSTAQSEAQLREVLGEMVRAMRRYQLDADTDAPTEHRAMMERAENALALPPSLHAKRAQAQAEENKNLKTLLGLMYDKYENGDSVVDDVGAPMGSAVRLNDEEDDAILAALKPSAESGERE